jgi:hypothetical protein
VCVKGSVLVEYLENLGHYISWKRRQRLKTRDSRGRMEKDRRFFGLMKYRLGVGVSHEL